MAGERAPSWWSISVAPMVGTGAARFRWRLAYASNGRVLSWLVTSEAQEAMAAYVQATERAGDLPL